MLSVEHLERYVATVDIFDFACSHASAAIQHKHLLPSAHAQHVRRMVRLTSGQRKG